MTDLRGFVDGGTPDDDLTVLAMRISESSGAPRPLRYLDPSYR